MNIFSSKILITGAAGFIGSALAKKLLIEGCKVYGIDNINNYYDQKLKKDRIKEIEKLNFSNWEFSELNIENKKFLFELFEKNKYEIVINLAAQAGVRYSIENPYSYINSNINGFINILEASRQFKVKNLIYASSSSVYGLNKKIPFREDDSIAHPISLYAATKGSNELMAHSYSHLFGISSIGLRFFTVYGPWGRPDMAPMIFLRSILKNETINVFNYGDMNRDFTYIDDVVETIFRCCSKPATSDSSYDMLNPQNSKSFAPHRIFNVGNSKPINLKEFINNIEKYTGKNIKKNYLPMQQGDVQTTYADTTLIQNWINFKPSTSLSNGIQKFINWYIEYYG